MMFTVISLILLVSSFSLSVTGEEDCFIDLATEKWALMEASGKVLTSTSVPAGVYSALERNNRLNESVGRNSGDEDDRWASRFTWDFQTAVYLTECTRGNDLFLDMEGVDTIADIYFNGWKVGQTNNMFTRYKFKIDPKHVGKEPHQIAVRVYSPIDKSKRFFEDYTNKGGPVVPPSSLPPAYSGENHVNFLRKMQASFAWDWGPSYPSAGIWKQIKLSSYNAKKMFQVREVLALPVLDKSTGKWQVNTEIICETPWSQRTLELALKDKSIEVQVTLDGQSISSFEVTEAELAQTPFVDRGNGSYFELAIRRNIIVNKEVDLWWPIGSGMDKEKYKPTLYNLTTDLKYNFKGQPVTHSVSRRIGFRTIEVVQEDVKPTGKTFYFKINSKPIFMRGSNWIPSNILPERSYDSAWIKRLLTDAADVNMNAIRVWGGGLYESDYFYDLADELGIFIWQDFMFACALYPTNKEFLDSVKVEVEQQVQRLKSHPSILIWAGNNENEAALQQNWWPEVDDDNYQTYAKDYRKLYVETIKPIVEKLDPSRVYVASSPSNMAESEAHGWIAESPGDPRFGDVHFYDYARDSWNVSTYPNARFVSEYGFQSWPVYESWVEVIDDTSCLVYPLKKCVSRRQHHPGGDEEIVRSIKRHFSLPSDVPFNKLALLSQWDQANAIKIESEYYRRNRQIDPVTGMGKTMGALYWQLNDVWVAPSWASIDNTGRWKALHFYARKFFSPILLSLARTGNEIEVHGVNDLVEESPELKVTLQIFRLNQEDNLTPVSELTGMPIKLQPSSSKVVLKNKLPADASPGLVARVFATKTDGSVFGENWLLVNPLSEVKNYTRPYIEVKSQKISDKVTKLTLTTDAIGTFVWIGPDRNNGRMQDNGFFMFEKKKEILFTLFDDQTATNEQFDWHVISA